MIPALQRRSWLVNYGIGAGVALLVIVIFYFGFVLRQQNKAAKAGNMAETLSKQLDKAQEYVFTHNSLAEQQKKIEEMTARVQAAVPEGPIDITVGSYVEKKAQEIGIDDLRWSIEGGIKPPASGGAADRLTTDPAKLKSSLVDIQFSAEYKNVLKFLHVFSPDDGDAPWPVEIKSLDIRRASSIAAGGVMKNYRVTVSMTARYVYL